MTNRFEYTDEDGGRFVAQPLPGVPYVLLACATPEGAAVPLDRLEEVIAGLRDMARQTGGQPTARPRAEAPPADALPQLLATTLTERFTALGNPHSRMTINFQGPDGWPASRDVSPNDVADVLREVLGQADGQPAPSSPCSCGGPGDEDTVHPTDGAPCYRSSRPLPGAPLTDELRAHAAAVLPPGARITAQALRAAEKNAPLSAVERQFLTFALDLAADRMATEDGFTDQDHTALDHFRRMTTEEPPTTRTVHIEMGYDGALKAAIRKSIRRGPEETGA
ncbi:hypothetical protein [Streptomyces sp. NPDC059949]|uniref:hypothetical protein n=1 Tax=Streptomyces sp. NPDC059949 TaxID=3347013 RepID=UPI0036460F56